MDLLFPNSMRLARALACWTLSIALAAPAIAGALPARPAIDQVDGPVHVALVFDNALIVGGDFQHAGGVAAGSLARWNGQAWSAVGPGFDGAVCALTVLQGRLVAGGAFEHAGGTVLHHVALWDGNAWQPLGAGTDGAVHALTTQADVVLYAAGAFTHAGDVEARGVARCIGTGWSAMGGGFDGEVRALVIYNGGLVAGGDCATLDSGGLDHHLARFVNGAWRALAPGIDGPVAALAVFEGSLIAAGQFENVDFVTPASHIARLTGDTWSAIGVGIANSDSTADVRALAVVGTGLVAGGEFAAAELRRARHVARWDGVEWSALGSGTDGPVATVAEYGGATIVGGNFTHAGGAAAASVAAFTSGTWNPLQSTAVLVSEAAASHEPDGVRVAWRFAPAALNEVAGVHVERATEPAAAGERMSSAELEVHTTMSVLDRTPDPALPWYRIVVERRDGGSVVAATVAAPAGATPIRTTLSPVAMPRRGAPVVIRYSWAAPAAVALQIFDVRGRAVAPIAAGDAAAGAHTVVWDRSDSRRRAVAPGVYFVHLTAGAAQATRKLVLTD